ncbi:MAG: gluconate 2-dehydrogenase subunit 3 family protein [Pseudomonadales bacterium]
MNRREAIKSLGIALGLSLSPALVRALSNPELSVHEKPLDQQYAKLIEVLSELVIPTTDTPGAIAAGVPEFINGIVSNWYTPAERDIFLSGLVDLNAEAQQQYGAPYVDLTEGQQILLLEAAELAASEYQSDDGMAMMLNLDEDLSPFFIKLKELVIVGYYTSEIGASQELNYNPMPMSYKGDIPLTDVGRAWAVDGPL